MAFSNNELWVKVSFDEEKLKELEQAAKDAKDHLDSLNDALDRVRMALRHIPEGFKAERVPVDD